MALFSKIARKGVSVPAVALILGVLPSLCFALGGILLVSMRSGSARWSAWLVAVLVLVDECTQVWQPGRTFDPADIVAIVIGSSIGLWVTRRSRMKRTMESPVG